MAMALGLALAAVWAPADSGTELLDAAAKGLTAKVGQLLAKGAGLGAKDKNGRTALMLAAQHGHAETVRVLLEKGGCAHGDR
jgi:ankyrin repeat protein